MPVIGEWISIMTESFDSGNLQAECQNINTSVILVWKFFLF